VQVPCLTAGRESGLGHFGNDSIIPGILNYWPASDELIERIAFVSFFEKNILHHGPSQVTAGRGCRDLFKVVHVVFSGKGFLSPSGFEDTDPLLGCKWRSTQIQQFN